VEPTTVDTLTGRLVVASHDLIDRTFRRAVVLVLAHDREAGAAGIVLNRPGPSAAPARLAPWMALAAPPAVLFVGGPVGPDTVIGVGASAGTDDPPGWQPVTSELGVFDLAGDVESARARLRAVRLFVGYAGWAAGQLESEIAAGAWFVVDAEVDDPLTVDPDHLWRTVLARQGGLFTTVPDDPGLN
jgi:putative transcriptional regulator